MEKTANGSPCMDLLEEVSRQLGVNSDDEDGLSTQSNYSSCGSELERYCSANSALGTASSVCSPVGNRSELFDNLRSLGLSENSEIFGGKEKLRCRSFGRKRNPVDLGRLDWLSDGTIESPRENGSCNMQVVSRMAGDLHGTGAGFSNSTGCNENNGGSLIDVGDEAGKRLVSFSEKNVNFEDCGANICARSLGVSASACEDHVSSSDNLDAYGRGSTSECCAQNRPLGLDGDDGNQSRFSDCESSALDSGTDDRARVRLVQREALQKLKNGKVNNERNLLLMNTAVAFGDNDWDDFVQESVGVGLTTTPLLGLKSSEQVLGHLNSEAFHLDAYASEGLGTMDTQENGHLENVGYMPSSSTSHHQVDEKNEAAKNSSIEDPQKVVGWKGLLQKDLVNTQAIKNFDAAKSNQIRRDGTNDKGSIAGFHGQDAPDDMSGGQLQFPLIEFASSEAPEVDGIQVKKKEANKATVPMMENDLDYKDIASNKANGPDGKELFEEMVLDMEEILLDSGELRQGRFAQAVYLSQHFQYRDGGSTTSTSDTNDTHAFYQHPFRIEGVEVVGAKQKKGNVSFGERLVGVKEYTVYRLRVWGGKERWEVERRYREFFSLYQQLKQLFKDHGLILPSPWLKVERESRKIFGNVSPVVVNERSCLIQDCLQSILNAKIPFGIPSSLILFLSPCKNNSTSSSSNFPPESLQSFGDDVKFNSTRCSDGNSEEVTTLGKKISLVVELKAHKLTRQLLEEQRYMCAGCHRHLDRGKKSLMQEFVKTMGLYKPRLCEYTGQLFCLSCHTGDNAVLPARVLHNWDFSLYPVSQLAKAYLESIYDKPMLCVSAVNPFLFSKVPALHHVMGIRRKVGAMVPYIRCPFRRSIQRGLGSRRYLLESNDFFALRDLVDLSKGPFAALPAILEDASSKILEHITQQCLICYDIGAPCAAKQACRDPASTILPFQEAESVRCSLCGAIFHEPCIRYLGGCPCSKLTNAAMNKKMMPSKSPAYEEPAELTSLPLQKTDSGASTTRFFYDLLSKATPEKLWKQKSSNPVILMGSLPSTSL